MSIRSQSWRVSLIGKEIPVTPPILLTVLPGGQYTRLELPEPCDLPSSVTALIASLIVENMIDTAAGNDCALATAGEAA